MLFSKSPVLHCFVNYCMKLIVEEGKGMAYSISREIKYVPNSTFEAKCNFRLF